MRQGESLASVCTADAHLVSGRVTATGRQRSITRHRFLPEGPLARERRAAWLGLRLCAGLSHRPMGSDPADASLEDIEVQIMDAHFFDVYENSFAALPQSPH